MGLMLLMAAGFFVFISVADTKKLVRPAVPDIYITKVVPVLDEVRIEAKKPELPKPETKKVATQKFVAKIEITRQENLATPLAKNLDSVAISGVTNAGDGSARQLVNGPALGTNEIPEIKKPDVPAVDYNTPMMTAEVMPSYPGGMEGLRKFLQKNLQNPEEMDEGDAVTVKIRFVVGYDGKLKSFETVQDGGEVFNNEVIRVLRKMPNWIPGKSRGENVSVYYMIPVKFTAAY